MKTIKIALATSLALAASAAQAAGPLFLWQDGDMPLPLKWNTDNGPIPVYTDGGPVDINGEPTFTFDYDGVTAFLTIERADEITQFAFDQWNQVSTSTFEAQVVGTIESVTGIADVTGANADVLYEAYNGYGFFVNYDTDGTILSDYFGVGNSVLGIAFPEWADEETGEILEATAVINGWAVYDTDTQGDMIAGVFTHEFGHAINLSHTQVNGDLVYAPPYANRSAGPRHCEPLGVMSAYEQIETMFPFISVSSPAAAAQSTVNVTDDKVAISNLYPAPGYPESLGSISGVLRLKDGTNEYSGINVIARNLDDPFYDAVSAMTGDQTQGRVGPDGRFTINGLTPGESYVLYINNIWAGGFPTTPMPIVSQAEYWNEAESNDPALDDICDYTPIVAEAGVSKNADITFNGYLDGVQYTPIVSAFLTDMSKNGKKSAGQLGATAFTWDAIHGFQVMPAEIKAGNVSINRNGQFLTVQSDLDGNGVGEATLVDFTGKSGDGKLIELGDLNGNSCGGTGQAGTNASYAWAVDDAAHTVVGTAYVDNDGDGTCSSYAQREVVPFIWTHDKNGGMRQLSVEGAPLATTWLRAHAVSGNGEVVLGSNGGSRAVAWVNEGELVDLYTGRDYRAREAYAVNYDGSRVAIGTYNNGPVLWNPFEDSYEEIGSLKWCVDMPYNHFFFGDLCAPGNRICPAGCTPEELESLAGPVPLLPLDMNDDGTVIVGRAGSFFTGFVGGLWVEGIGWMALDDFLRKQGVAEAFDFPMDNPISIDGTGNKLVGGLAGATMSWYVDLSQVFVCKNGKTVSTSFPAGVRKHIENGAQLGRCAFID